MTTIGWIGIAIGGALGATARYAMSHQVTVLFGKEMAWGTLSVNVLGSFLMGLMVILMVDKYELSAEWRAFVMVGFLGGFTTFSTFSLQTMEYLQTGEINRAFFNIAISVVASLMAIWAGLYTGRQFLGN
ncbi:MAG: fluoride efflux transporter CrcB [Gammaproteobacteria bacterium]|nr:fluoride efflux transporter CrcB [Gammaproteobacteria bacterium]